MTVASTRNHPILTERADRVRASIPRATEPAGPIGDHEGRPLYRMGEAPEHLRTLAQLTAERRKPSAVDQPDAYVRTGRSHRSTARLYDLANTLALPPMSERQLTAWVARRTCVGCGDVATSPQPCQPGPRCQDCGRAHRAAEYEARIRTCQGCGSVAADPWPGAYNRCPPCTESYGAKLTAERAERERRRREPTTQHARELLADPLACVLDLETTGLGIYSPAYAVEAAVLAMDGTVLLHTLINPRHLIEDGARAVHGITEEEVRDAPTWDQVLPELVTVLSGRRICIYNEEFDTRIMRYEMHRYHKAQDPEPTPTGQWHRLAREWVDALDTECAMELYAEWYGELHHSGDYRFQPLRGGHRAVADCQALLKRLWRMAELPVSQPQLP